MSHVPAQPTANVARRNAKALAAAIAVPTATILVWVLRDLAGMDLPAEIETAIVALVTGIVTFVVPNG